MKTPVLIAAAVGLAACAPPFVHRGQDRLKPIARLGCPESAGGLTRSSQAPDGSACAYSGPDGALVQLKLTPVAGSPEAVTAPLDEQLKAELPPSPPPPSSGPAPSGDRDRVDITLPGVSIHAGDGGANVRVPGVNVDADDQHGSVHVTGHAPAGPPGAQERGQVIVDANDSGAVIHARSFGPNFEDSLIEVSRTPGPQGWRTVGYEVLGPRSGPLVVATVQSKAEDHEGLFRDVKALVRKAARG